MFKNKQKSITYTLLIVTTLILIMNYLYRESLYLMGTSIITQIQKDHSEISLFFFRIITTISEPALVMVAVLCIALGETKRKHAFNVTIYLLFNIFLITLLKQFYIDPRPFWTDPNIRSLSVYCPAEFGNPSGHSWFATVFLFLLTVKYFPKMGQLYALGGSALLIFLVAFSRMYLGAHSLDQVLLGVCLGMVMNVLYFICGLDDRISQFLENFNIAPKLGWKKYMLIFHTLYFLAYYHGQNTLKNQQKTYQIYHQRASQQCGNSHTMHSINFAMLLASALAVNFGSGFALGYQSMSLCQRGRKYLEGSWQINEQRYPERIGKSLHYLVQFACLFSGIAAAYTIVQLFRMQKWASFFIMSGGAMLSGYLYTRKSCELLYKFSIICEVL